KVHVRAARLNARLQTQLARHVQGLVRSLFLQNHPFAVRSPTFSSSFKLPSRLQLPKFDKRTRGTHTGHSKFLPFDSALHVGRIWRMRHPQPSAIESPFYLPTDGVEADKAHAAIGDAPKLESDHIAVGQVNQFPASNPLVVVKRNDPCKLILCSYADHILA